MTRIKYWSCECGFGGNLWYDQTCRGCNAPVPLSPPRHAKPRPYVAPDRDEQSRPKDELL